MGIRKFTDEIKVRVSAKRLFKALVTEPHTNLPKILPNAVKSVEILQGDGGPGTVRQTNFNDGTVKHKVEELDIHNCATKYTLIEGTILGDKVDSIYYDQKFVDSSDGGCVIKIACEYRAKSGVQLKEEDVKAGKDQFLGYFRLAEEYLLAHPEVCA